MAEGSELETYANYANSTTVTPRDDVPAPALRDKALQRALIFVGIAAASAAVAFAIVRATLVRAPADPTTERIQQLIDEANRLLAQLDDKKSDS